ncbi:8-oxo-dGTP pyrophosphatase MutT (NUDIX family) [Psychromicrobium silvestre]|uniref:8-oxo-dGTP pyrophosphatase MutT (NUDIX family) n=1 Tax=Psychromicrobium silvestre TaxID=1645614 RepID=A0A7Y9S4F0_9MICC|nr:8-oxo-dGTP pyrophosphatase MutT (NUDIX family) [Psychromicrobium silvestre]
MLQLRHGTGYMDGYWSTAAAGHIEANESAAQTAIREANEELGVFITPEQLVPLTVMHRTQGNGHAIDERVDFFFVCTAWRGEPQMMEPEKVADLRWFPLDDLPAALVPHERYVFERLESGLTSITAYGFATN